MSLLTSDYQNKIDTISDWYYQSTKLNKIDVCIEFTDNIFQRKLELETNNKQREFILNNKEYENNINGTTILSGNLNELPYILISTKTAENSDQYISTITHELTHLHDFYDIINYYNLKYSKEFYDNKKCCLFTNWSEYHAKQVGYSFFKAYEYGTNNYNKPQILNFILNEELPKQTNLLIDSCEKHENVFEFKQGELMGFLGRFSVWQSWFPKHISIERVFAENQYVINIYNFLLTHESFEKIITSLDEFDKILNLR